MNILIDLRWMTIGKAGGMEQLAFELVASIGRICREGIVFVYCPQRTFREWRFDSPSVVQCIDSDVTTLVPQASLLAYNGNGAVSPSCKLGCVLNDYGASSVERVADIDLVHSIGGYISPELRQYRHVLTILDLQHVHFPEFFSPDEIRAREQNHAEAIRISERVICISEAVKRDVIRHFKVEEEKLSASWVIPSGHAWLRPSKRLVEKVLGPLRAPTDFLLFPSHAWLHKNHARLVDAFAIVRESFPNLTLVFTGGEIGESHPAKTQIERHNLSESVVHLGYCTPLEIRCLLERAQALVYPSLFEGFGLPVAEAILAGTPVVCSDIAPLNEIGGEALVTFDPTDEKDIARKIISVLQDDTLRNEKLALCKERRSLFSPDTLGLQILNTYREACGLDLIDSVESDWKPNLKHELARHWVRRSDRNRKEGQRLLGLFDWFRALLNSPRLALSGIGKRKEPLPGPFRGRYGDGWIGTEFEEWLMVPEGASGLEIDLEGRPAACDGQVGFQIHMEGKHTYEGSITDGATETVVVNLPESPPEISSIHIRCDHSFTPREIGASDDSRKLSLKLNCIRWRR